MTREEKRTRGRATTKRVKNLRPLLRYLTALNSAKGFARDKIKA